MGSKKDILEKYREENSLYEYRDRGIIKWAPFDALKSGISSLESAVNDRDIVAVEDILDDKLNEFDVILQIAIQENRLVNICFFDGGEITEISGMINKLDYNNKIIILNNNIKIKVGGITEISVI